MNTKPTSFNKQVFQIFENLFVELADSLKIDSLKGRNCHWNYEFDGLNPGHANLAFQNQSLKKFLF
jgi:hypothetical protein